MAELDRIITFGIDGLKTVKVEVDLTSIIRKQSMGVVHDKEVLQVSFLDGSRFEVVGPLP